MKKIKLLKTILIPILGISTMGIVTTVATSCNNSKPSTYSVSGGSATLNGVYGTPGNDKNEWKLTKEGQEVTEGVTWSIVKPVSGVSIVNGKVLSTDEIPSGTYKFKVAANYNNQTYTSAYINLTITDKYEVTGGNLSLSGKEATAGFDEKTWVLKKDGEVITEGVTWSIVEPVSGVSIKAGKVSWTNAISDGTYEFKVAATYEGRTSTSNTITLIIDDIYKVKGSSKHIDVGTNRSGYDKDNSWSLIKDGEVITEGVTWELVATEGSSVPNWIKLNENNEISWTNAVKGIYTFYIQASYDEKIFTSSSPFILNVDDYLYDSLKITPNKDGTFEMLSYGDNNPNLLYSFDKSNWNEYSEKMNIQKGQTLYLRGNNSNGWSHHLYVYSQFRITGDISVSGNIMALLDNGTKTGDEGDIIDIPCDYCFINLFENCSELKSVDEYLLPATTLKSYCYDRMFEGCTSLTKAPELPADELEEGCYDGMFENCISLTRAPELLATTLASGCYSDMFANCSNITRVSILPAKTLAIGCYNEMFYRCNKLSKAPKILATTLAESCCSSMFENCTSLTEAPELPATKLTKACYRSMFENCTSLTKAPALPAIVLPDKCYSEMFRGCSSIDTPPNLDNIMNVYKESCKYMFADCTSLVVAPNLTATIISEGSYYGMFEGCTSLVAAYYIGALTLGEWCFGNMFYNCHDLTSVRIAYSGVYIPNYFGYWVNGVADSGIFFYNGDLTAQHFGFPANWITSDQNNQL